MQSREIRGSSKHGIGNNRKTVSDDKFLKETPADTEKVINKALPVKWGRIGQLRAERGETLDGTDEELREEGNEKRIMEEKILG